MPSDPWPTPWGAESNSRTAAVALSGQGQVAWRIRLPEPDVTAILVAADGTCFVSSPGSLTALRGQAIRWSIDTGSPAGCLLTGDGHLVTWEAKKLVVRSQETGEAVSAIDAPLRCSPALTPDGLLVFATSSALHATTPAGEPVWRRELDEAFSPYPPLVHHNQVVVADRGALRAFDLTGRPLWMVNEGAPGETNGPVVGLPDGSVLAAVRTGDLAGYLVISPSGQQHKLHLPPRSLAVPLPGNLIAVPGWPEEDDSGQFQPVLTLFDIEPGSSLWDHRVPAAVHTMAAGSNGMIAIAGNPSRDRWEKYRDWPGFDLAGQCYVHFLDKDGLRAQWQPGDRITGPLAVGHAGELLVPVSGDLYGIQ
jgi:hypothetical protein